MREQAKRYAILLQKAVDGRELLGREKLSQRSVCLRYCEMSPFAHD